jgi:thymidylate synthase
MKQYLDLVQHVMDNGCQKEIEPEQVQKCFRLSNALWLKRRFSNGNLRNYTSNLLWATVVLKGDTNIKYLQENGVKIWDAWANTNGVRSCLRSSVAQLEQWRNRSNRLITELKRTQTVAEWLFLLGTHLYFQTIQNHLRKM